MSKVIKILMFIIIIITILFSFADKTYALSSVIEDGKSFLEEGKSGNGKANFGGMEANLSDISGYLYNILLTLGVVIAVIIATILGIQFMIGGAEGQAKVKERIIPFVVGCIVVFGGFGFWKLAVTLGKRIDSAYINNREEIVQIAYIEEI